MTLKTLVTGVTAVAVVAAAAGGVTSVASSASPSTQAIQPVVFGAPLPQAPAPDLVAPLQQTINALGSAGSFGSKLPYIEQFTLGRGSAEKQYNSAVAKGYFPLTATVAPDVDLNGNVATANVTAVSANGRPAGPIALSFLASPSSPTGWVLSKGSLLTLGSAMG